MPSGLERFQPGREKFLARNFGPAVRSVCVRGGTRGRKREKRRGAERGERRVSDKLAFLPSVKRQAFCVRFFGDR